MRNVLQLLAAAALGAAAAVIGSMLTSVLVTFWVGRIHSHFEAMPWLLGVSVVPGMCAGIACACIRARWGEGVARRRWVALAVAYVMLAVSGSLGAIAEGVVTRGSPLRRPGRPELHHLPTRLAVGWQVTNASGYLTGCWIYALVLLPLGYPLARVVLRLTPPGRRSLTPAEVSIGSETTHPP